MPEPSASFESNLQTLLGSRFVLHERLKQGGFAEVFRATDTRMQTDVAVKVLRPTVFSHTLNEERFLREIRLLGELRHPGIVPILDFAHGNGLTAYWMPLLTGPTLAEQIARGELFTLGPDYLALGGRVEWTPRLNMFVNQILNLHDESGFSQLRFELDAAQDFFIWFGVNLPYGRNGSEFGGIRIPASESLLSRGTTGYVRTAIYF